MRKQSSNREAIYKAQAQRLRAFLGRAGVELKNTHSLEAIAHIHGSPNWQALVKDQPSDEASAQSTPSGDPDPEPNAFYCIATLTPKFLSISLAEGRDLALRDFIQTARILADLFATSEAELRVVGQDLDYGFPVLQLSRPKVTNDEEIVPDKNGVLKARKMRPVPLCGLEEAASYVSIAAAMTAAFATRRKDETQPRYERACDTHPALQFGLDCEVELPELALESHRELNPPPVPCDPRSLLLAMDTVRVMHTVFGMVRGGVADE